VTETDRPESTRSETSLFFIPLRRKILDGRRENPRCRRKRKTLRTTPPVVCERIPAVRPPDGPIFHRPSAAVAAFFSKIVKIFKLRRNAECRAGCAPDKAPARAVGGSVLSGRHATAPAPRDMHMHGRAPKVAPAGAKKSTTASSSTLSKTSRPRKRLSEMGQKGNCRIGAIIAVFVRVLLRWEPPAQEERPPRRDLRRVSPKWTTASPGAKGRR
jgi:hypothetical protein